jgi:hypothetical protein
MARRDILGKDELISRLEAMQQRQAKHGDTFDFEFYVALTFASTKLVDELAPIVLSGDGDAFYNKMHVYKDRLRDAPGQIRKSLAHHLGRRRSQLKSFSDMPELLEQLKK